MNEFVWLQGNVVNGTIGKQMVDTLVESASNVEVKHNEYCNMLSSIKGWWLNIHWVGESQNQTEFDLLEIVLVQQKNSTW